MHVKKNSKTSTQFFIFIFSDKKKPNTHTKLFLYLLSHQQAHAPQANLFLFPIQQKTSRAFPFCFQFFNKNTPLLYKVILSFSSSQAKRNRHTHKNFSPFLFHEPEPAIFHTFIYLLYNNHPLKY